jgi:hypothetical protein
MFILVTSVQRMGQNLWRHHAEILSLKGDSYRLKNHNLGARPAIPPTD